MKERFLARAVAMSVLPVPAGSRSPSPAAGASPRQLAGSGRPRLTHPRRPGFSGGVSPFIAPAAPERAFQPPPLVLAELARAAWLEERLPVGRVPGLDLAAALELGVELGAEQDRDVRNPQPDKEDDHATERA